jgi:hypothetical protein
MDAAEHYFMILRLLNAWGNHLCCPRVEKVLFDRGNHALVPALANWRANSCYYHYLAPYGARMSAARIFGEKDCDHG